MESLYIWSSADLLQLLSDACLPPQAGQTWRSERMSTSAMCSCCCGLTLQNIPLTAGLQILGRRPVTFRRHAFEDPYGPFRIPGPGPLPVPSGGNAAAAKRDQVTWQHPGECTNGLGEARCCVRFARPDALEADDAVLVRAKGPDKHRVARRGSRGSPVLPRLRGRVHGEHGLAHVKRFALRPSAQKNVHRRYCRHDVPFAPSAAHHLRRRCNRVRGDSHALPLVRSPPSPDHDTSTNLRVSRSGNTRQMVGGRSRPALAVHQAPSNGAKPDSCPQCRGCSV